nr:elongation of very long chain fatty acids protein 8 [Apocyclops royi]
MSAILEAIWDRRDSRVDDWPLMSSPLPTLLLCSLYFYAVKIWGPQFMKERKPYDLKNILIAYNAVQVIFSAWILYEILMAGWLTGYSFMCEPVDQSPNGLRMANAAWWYFFSKFTEFFDTFFFIARKKFDNVSTLHVVHHGIMPFFAWQACRFVPGGHESFGALFNTFIHVVMYTYYGLAALGPTVQPYLWWKKYLTKLQMTQFVTVLAHSLILFVDNPCGFPVIHSALSIGHMALFFVLFAQFYTKAYSTKKKSN